MHTSPGDGGQTHCVLEGSLQVQLGRLLLQAVGTCAKMGDAADVKCTDRVFWGSIPGICLRGCSRNGRQSVVLTQVDTGFQGVVRVLSSHCHGDHQYSVYHDEAQSDSDQ